MMIELQRVCTREVDTSKVKPAAEAAASSGSNCRGGGVGCRRSSAHAGYAARIACSRVNMTSAFIAQPIGRMSPERTDKWVGYVADLAYLSNADVCKQHHLLHHLVRLTDLRWTTATLADAAGVLCTITGIAAAVMASRIQSVSRVRRH